MRYSREIGTKDDMAPADAFVREARWTFSASRLYIGKSTYLLFAFFVLP